MINTLKDAILTIAIISAPFAIFAVQKDASKKAYNLPTYTIEDIAALPQPTYNPIPSIKSQFVGLNLKVKFTVNADGTPESVRLAKPLSSYSDVERLTFASRIQEQVKNWQFEPAIDTNGNAIEVKVIMPVQVVKKGANYTALASLILDTPEKDRS